MQNQALAKAVNTVIDSKRFARGNAAYTNSERFDVANAIMAEYMDVLGKERYSPKDFGKMYKECHALIDVVYAGS